MLQPQITFAFSPYTALYDLIVPKDIMPRQNNVKAKTKERYKIEAKNSELKTVWLSHSLVLGSVRAANARCYGDIRR